MELTQFSLDAEIYESMLQIATSICVGSFVTSLNFFEELNTSG